MRVRDLLPAAAVVALAVAAPLLEQGDDGCPAASDGPQFRCWLVEHGEP